MAKFRNPKIASINGHSVSLKGSILVPFAQDLTALFLEFKNTTAPLEWPPSDFMQADKLVRDFAQWCHATKGYTVVLDEDVTIS